MKTCKNCFFWGEDFDGECDFPKTILSEKDPDTRFMIEVTANDDQGLDYHLITGPNFGCIHFKENKVL